MKKLLSALVTSALLITPVYANEKYEVDFEEELRVNIDMNADGIDDILTFKHYGVESEMNGVCQYRLTVNDTEFISHLTRGNYCIEDIIDLDTSDNATEILLRFSYHGATLFEIIRYENGELFPLTIDYGIQEKPNLYNYTDFIYSNYNGCFVEEATAPIGYEDKKDVKNIYKEVVRGTLTLLSDDNITVRLNDTDVEYDIPPFFANDRTMVGVRYTFEAMGAEVAWEEETQTVTATKGDTTISLKIGEEIMYKNGEPIEMDTSAVVLSGRTFIPLHYVAEAFNYNLEWNEEANTAIISE